MEKGQKLEMWAILGTNFAVAALVIALFTWNRSESRSDYRHHDEILKAIEIEMRDFHGRLCAIEERGRK